MAEFSKTLKAPSVNTQTPRLEMSGGSLATDLAAAGQFAFDLYQSGQQREAAAQQQEVLTQKSAEYNSGVSLAQKHIAKLSQLTGTRQSLAKRRFQQEALSSLPPSALEGYLEVTKETGLGLAVAEEQELEADLRQQAMEQEQNLIQEGREIVLASASDDSTEMQELYKKYGEDGWTSEEFKTLAMLNRGKKEIASRRAAEINKERAALGMQQDEFKQATQAKVNEEVIGLANQLRVPAALTSKALASRNPDDVITAKEGLKVRANKIAEQFRNFLGNLSPEEKASIDITAVTSQFSALTNQIITFADRIDPVKTNKDLAELLVQSRLAFWLDKGSPAQTATAYSVFMGMPMDAELAKMAINREASDLSGNTPMAVDIVNRLNSIMSGYIDTNDHLSPLAIQKSSAEASEKVPLVAQYVAQGANNVPVHKPEILKPLLATQEQVANDPSAAEFMRTSLEEQGYDPFEVLRDQHAVALEKTIWPSLVDAGYEQAMVTFEVTGSGIRAVREKGNRPVFEPGNIGDRRVQKALRQSTNLLNRMAKAVAKISDVPESDMYEVYAGLLNKLNGTYEEPEEDSGENQQQENQ